MTNYADLFTRKAEQPDLKEVFEADLKGFLKAFEQSQNGLVKLEKPNPKTLEYRLRFYNEGGCELSRVQLGLTDVNGDKKPDFYIAGWNDVDIEELGVATKDSMRILSTAAADNLEAYRTHHDDKNGNREMFISYIAGVKTFDEVQTTGLANALGQYADEIQTQKVRYNYRLPTPSAERQPLTP